MKNKNIKNMKNMKKNIERPDAWFSTADGEHFRIHLVES